MTARVADAAMVTVIDATIVRGFLLSRGKLGFEAFTAPDERSLGVFSTQGEAADAILKVRP